MSQAPTLTPEDLAALTRPQLNDHAASVGVAEPGSLNNKGEVIAAIEAASAPSQPDDSPSAAGDEPDAKPERKATASKASKGERRPITYVTDRGDWQDPFVDGEPGDYLVYFGDDVSERTGARREGDEAVLDAS